MKQPKTTARLIETAERRAFVLKLRLSGATYRDISARTIKRFGVERLPRGYDERYVWQDVTRDLARINRDRYEAAEGVRVLELERLDRLLLALWSRAARGDVQAIDRVLKIMGRRAKMLGVDAPVKSDVTLNVDAVLAALPPAFREEVLRELRGGGD